VLLLVSIGVPSLLLIAGFLAALFGILNLPFYRLLMRKHGVLFTLAAIPWHAFFYLYSGVGFLLGSFRFLGRNLGSGARVRPAGANRTSEYHDATPKAMWEDINV